MIEAKDNYNFKRGKQFFLSEEKEKLSGRNNQQTISDQKPMNFHQETSDGRYRFLIFLVGYSTKYHYDRVEYNRIQKKSIGIYPFVSFFLGDNFSPRQRGELYSPRFTRQYDIIRRNKQNSIVIDGTPSCLCADISTRNGNILTFSHQRGVIVSHARYAETTPDRDDVSWSEIELAFSAISRTYREHCRCCSLRNPNSVRRLPRSGILLHFPHSRFSFHGRRTW